MELSVLEDIRRVLVRIREIKTRFSNRSPVKLDRSVSVYGRKRDFKAALDSEIAKIGKDDSVREIINRISRKYGIDPMLAMAIAKVESGYNSTAVSPMGAKGIMQLMPSTASALGVRDIFSVEGNIEGGIKYLRLLSDRYKGNIDKVLAAYNAGTGTVEKYGGVPPYKETQDYVRKVKEMYKRLKEGE